MGTPDEWLIRTADNQISGPFSRQQIMSMIQSAELTLEDEICGAGNYWIYLHENQEVKAQLGIDVPKTLYKNPQEATLTETETDLGERTDPQNIAAMGAASAARATVRPKESPASPQGENDLDAVPELPELAEEVGENTAVMSNRAFRDYRNKKAAPAAPTASTPHVSPSSSSAPSSGPAHASAAVPHHREPVPVSPDKNLTDKNLNFEKSKLAQYLAFILMTGAVIMILLVIRLLRQPPG
jgi:hypothetical protein